MLAPKIVRLERYVYKVRWIRCTTSPTRHDNFSDSETQIIFIYGCSALPLRKSTTPQTHDGVSRDRPASYTEHLKTEEWLSMSSSHS
jgi:hypothetical protein